MAQHDFVIANQGFPATRSDINNFLQAVATTHSGTSTPSGAVAGTIWLDTTSATAPILKYYDGTDNITLATIDHVANTVNFSDSALDLITDTTPQLGGDLDANGNDIQFDDNTGIRDDSDNEQLTFQKTASAVNELTITNAATANAPELSATGNDTNIDLKLTPKGTGKLNLDGIKFPNTDGTAGQFLKTDGAGNLSFSTQNGPTFRAIAGTTTTLTANTFTKINFTTEEWDTNSNFASSRFTPTVAGYYQINAAFGEGLSTSGMQFYIEINKSGSRHALMQYITASAWYTNIPISSIVFCNGTTDYIEIFAFTSSAYTNTAGLLNHFDGAMIRSA